ncbi:MAG: UDP-3-O-(3-hydroxymyristoyl)glucosamine N-acyltransferase [Candidatus Riflebacteria bacterium HGW-Riflebacteria-1]|jgi:acetyltransferase-like isoleucine patch superfamily enzyme|nr:MAG: UDP-3-O-(3-hydroxymyristoyl)glucosamine N-acyltransferase [Candidatus Riflebacteria bacterium HGW-Riflebacteria-1]
MNEPVIFQSQIKNVNFGKDVKVVTPVNLYDCTIGNNTFIGPFVEIQKGVKIGDNCKIQSHSFVCELVSIGNNTVVAHGVMFINDLFAQGGPANGKKELWKKTLIGNNVSIGSNATILPVEICDNVVIGAGSVVTRSITEPGVYAGNPAKKLRSI